VALVVGIAVGAGGGGGSKKSESGAKGGPKQLDLGVQVGQLLISSFDGTELPDYVRRRLQDGQTAGVILFGGNVQDPEQLTALTKSIQQAAGSSALVGTDQEGGPIRSIDFAGPDKAQPQMSSSAEVRSLYLKAGRALRRLGVNVDFAPVADVANGGSSILQGRVFRGGYGQVVAALK